jgi:hypothetical protein
VVSLDRMLQTKHEADQQHGESCEFRGKFH